VTVVVAWLALAVAFAHPPHGLDVNVCWTKAATGVPCPGCGLTRSLSCAARGKIDQSVRYHPMGPVVLALMAIVAGSSLLPAPARARLRAAIDLRTRVANVVYFTFVAAFVGCGVVRAIAHLPTALS
jgi:hypothetical protein